MLKIKEVAAKLGVHDNTVRRLINRGELPAYRVGRVVRIKEADAERYLREHRYTGNKGGEE